MLNEIGDNAEINEVSQAIIINIPESIYPKAAKNKKTSDLPSSVFQLSISNRPNNNFQNQTEQNNNNSINTNRTKASNRRKSKFNNPLNPAGRRRGVHFKSDKYGWKESKIGITKINNSSNSWLSSGSRLLKLFEVIISWKIFDYIVVIAIFCALFFAELKNLFTSKEDERPFIVIYKIIMGFYFGQTFLLSVVQKDFWFSIRFYIDILVLWTWIIENEGWVEDIVHWIYPSLLRTYVLKINKQTNYYKHYQKNLNREMNIYILIDITQERSEVKNQRNATATELKEEEGTEKIEKKQLITYGQTMTVLNESNIMINNYIENKKISIKNNSSIALSAIEEGNKGKVDLFSKNNNLESIQNWLNQTSTVNNPMRELNNQSNLKKIRVNKMRSSTTLSYNKEYRMSHGDEETPENAWLKLMKSNYMKEKKRLECEIESKMTKIVAKKVTERLIIIMLIWLLIFPILGENNYVDTLNISRLQYFCDILNTEVKLNNGLSADFNRSWYHLIEGTKDNWFFRVINITYINPDLVLYRNSTLDTSYRFFEIGYSYYSNGNILISYSNKDYSNGFSIVNIMNVILIGAVLLTISFFILQDTKNLILAPLVLMISTVNVVAKDPVNYRSWEKWNKLMSGFITIKNNKSKRKSNRSSNINNKWIDFEIKTIQYAVIRISSLIAIGFGEAGGQILKENMNSSEGLNPMLEGKKIDSVFGFCLIRNFAEINEVLQEKTIWFVNDIADIVHTNVFKFGGACNKNIGESFLLVWKFPDWERELVNSIMSNYNKSVNQKHNIKQKYIWMRNSPKMKLQEGSSSPIVTPEKTSKANDAICGTTIGWSWANFNFSQLPYDTVKPVNQSLTWKADCAVLSFLNIIKKIRKSPKILKYSKDINLQKWCEKSKNKKTFRVKMGFGLHVGWGIEGAIGSFYKIDCSYWSPNVNIAARWETATNIYGVEWWWSGEWHNLLSPSLQNKCREIDTVTLKGSISPVTWFTIDINDKITRGKVKDDNVVSGKTRRINNDMKKVTCFMSIEKRISMTS